MLYMVLSIPELKPSLQVEPPGKGPDLPAVSPEAGAVGFGGRGLAVTIAFSRR
jgi:hypothetical protein